MAPAKPKANQHKPLADTSSRHGQSVCYDNTAIKQEPSENRATENERNSRDALIALAKVVSESQSRAENLEAKLKEEQICSVALKSTIDSLKGSLVAKDKLQKSAESASAKADRDAYGKDAQIAYWKVAAHRATVASAMASGEDQEKALKRLSAGDPAAKHGQTKPKRLPAPAGPKRKFASSDFDDFDDGTRITPRKKTATDKPSRACSPPDPATPDDINERRLRSRSDKASCTVSPSGLRMNRHEDNDEDDDDDDDDEPLILKFQRAKQQKKRRI